MRGLSLSFGIQIQVPWHVITFFNKSGSLSIRPRMSVQICRLPRFLGTIFAFSRNPFVMFKRSCESRLTVSLTVLTVSVIIRTLDRRSFRTISSVFEEHGRPLTRWSSSTSSRPSRKRAIADFPSFTGNFKSIHAVRFVRLARFRDVQREYGYFDRRSRE